MDKRIKNILGRKNYLLGKKDGVLYWLQEASFDCGWYWGIGYIEVYNKRYTDIEMHTHFKSEFEDYNTFLEGFEDSTLTKSEAWQVLEIMKTLYTMREYADTCHRGGAHFTTNPCKDDILNKDEWERINQIVIPTLLKKLHEIIGGE